MLLISICAVSIIVSALLLLGRSYHLLIALTVASGALQAPLMSLTETSAFQFIDDIPAAFLVLAAGLHVATSRDRSWARAVWAVAGLTALVGFALVRSPDLGVGVAQARQVLLPLGLVFAGYVLKDLVQWHKLLSAVIWITMFAAAWVVLEEVLQRPLISPTWYYTEVVGGSRESMRQGLPPAYIADGVNSSEPVFRPGGPFMNPPVMGFLLGLGAYATVARLKGFTRISLLIPIAAALVVSYARAGILLFVAVTLLYFIWVKVGKYAAVVVSGIVGVYLVSTFIEQGNTASHSDGLLSGLQTGLTSPLGLGFGTTGYQAALEGAEVGAGSESLLGLYFAWLGVPMVLATLAVGWHYVRLLQRTPRKAALIIWLSLAFLFTVASSESASSIASTPVLWLLSGYVLGLRPVRPSGPRRQANVSRAMV